jgi:hypothetical protein
MSDDRRWTLTVHAVNGRICANPSMCECELQVVEVMPVSPVVPLATLRDFVKKWELGLTGPSPLHARTVLAGLTFLLDEFERTTNHNEGEKEC